MRAGATRATLVVLVLLALPPLALAQFSDAFPSGAPSAAGGGGGPGSDTTAFHQDGDAFGAAATVGTNDANTLSLETGGTARWTVAAGSSALMCTADGTAGAPVVTRSTDTDTGLYFPASDQFAVTVGGTAKSTWAATAQVSSVPINGSAGSAASPSFGFSGDPGNGLYNAGNDVIGFAVNGAEAARLNTTGLGVGTASPQAAVDVGTGRYTGGTNSATLRTYLNMSGQSVQAAVDFVFPGGDSDVSNSGAGKGIYRSSQFSLLGTNDIFWQAVPLTTAGNGYIEAYESAGMVIGTGNLLNNTTAPIIFRPNRTEQMRLTSGGLLGLGATVPTALFQARRDQNAAMFGVKSTNATNGTAAQAIVSAEAGANSVLLSCLPAAYSVTSVYDRASGAYLQTAGAGGLAVAATGGPVTFHAGGNTEVGRFSTTSQTNTVPLLESAGSAAAPSVAFSGDTDTGLYSVGADVLGISVGGTVRAKATTTGLTTGADVAYISGAGAAPVTTYAWDALSDGVSFLPHFDSTTSVATSSAVGYNVTFGEGVVIGGPTNTSGLILAAPSATASLVYAVDHATGNDVQLQIKGTTVDLALSGAAPKVLINSVAASGTCTLDGAATATCTATVPTGTACACSDTQPATNGVAAIACANAAGTLTATSSVTLDGSVVSYVCL